MRQRPLAAVFPRGAGGGKTGNASVASASDAQLFAATMTQSRPQTFPSAFKDCCCCCVFLHLVHFSNPALLSLFFNLTRCESHDSQYQFSIFSNRPLTAESSSHFGGLSGVCRRLSAKHSTFCPSLPLLPSLSFRGRYCLCRQA